MAWPPSLLLRPGPKEPSARANSVYWGDPRWCGAAVLALVPSDQGAVPGGVVGCRACVGALVVCPAGA